MASVAQSQDAFKRSTLKAMAAGGSDPYGDSNDEVAAAEAEALKGQAGDAQGAGAPSRIADSIASPITGGTDAVQNYLGEMQGAQAAHDQAFATASAGYAPPPIYSLSSPPSSGSTGISEDDLATKELIFPSEYGGGLRYGGFRTQAEGNAAVLGAANMEARALAEQQAMLDAQALKAQAAADEARRGFKPRMPVADGGKRAPVVSRGLRTADQEGKEARFAHVRSKSVPRPAPTGLPGYQLVAPKEAHDEGRRIEQAIVADMLRASAPPRRPVVSRGLRLMDEERKDYAAYNPAGVASRQANQAVRDFVMPEDWELQQQAALDWNYNPYIAAGLYDEPTAGERNAGIRTENELAERLTDPEGRTMAERAAQERALLDATYGSEAVDEAARYGITPDEYLTIGADPTFAQAAEDAQAIFYDTGGNMDQVESALIEYGLSPAAISMILDSFGSAGVNPNSSSADPGYVYGGG